MLTFGPDLAWRIPARWARAYFELRMKAAKEGIGRVFYDARCCPPGGRRRKQATLTVARDAPEVCASGRLSSGDLFVTARAIKVGVLTDGRSALSLSNDRPRIMHETRCTNVGQLRPDGIK